MTIKKGEPWGEPATPPVDALRASTDREVSRALEAARRDAAPFAAWVLAGGDLHRTLGGTTAASVRFVVDVGEALVDGRHHYFVAHAVARSHWRDAAIAMNAQWLGDWNLGPKGHPNDGRLDVSELRLQRLEWRKVRARLASGTHLPHPRIETRRTQAANFEFARPTPVYLDGEHVANAKTLAVRLIADGLTVYA